MCHGLCYDRPHSTVQAPLPPPCVQAASSPTPPHPWAGYTPAGIHCPYAHLIASATARVTSPATHSVGQRSKPAAWTGGTAHSACRWAAGCYAAATRLSHVASGCTAPARAGRALSDSSTRTSRATHPIGRVQVQMRPPDLAVGVACMAVPHPNLPRKKHQQTRWQGARSVPSQVSQSTEPPRAVGGCSKLQQQ